MESIMNVYWIYELIKVIILLLIALFLFLKSFIKKESRLFKNINRPIMIFSTKDTVMEVEYKLLKDTKFFNIPESPTNSIQSIDRIKDHRLVIIAYDGKNDNEFLSIYNQVSSKGIPIIVYSKLIPANIIAEMNKYSYYSMCGTPLRLLNDAYTILSTFPDK